MLLPIQTIMYENQISRVFRNFPVYELHLTEEDIASCSRAFGKPNVLHVPLDSIIESVIAVGVVLLWVSFVCWDTRQ